MEFLEGVLLKQVSKDFKSGALTLSDPAFLINHSLGRRRIISLPKI